MSINHKATCLTGEFQDQPEFVVCHDMTDLKAKALLERFSSIYKIWYSLVVQVFFAGKQASHWFCEGVLSDPCLNRDPNDLILGSDPPRGWWCATQSLSTWFDDMAGNLSHT